MATQHHVQPTASHYVLAVYVLYSLISETPCCMLHFEIEWESVWYPDVLGRKFGEEIGAAWGIPAKLVLAGATRGVLQMYRFLIVIEKANGNFSAYSPDLPGCVATGKTREQVTRNMHEAIEMHVRGLLEDKLPVPKPRAFAEYVAVL